ncbi:LuxR C-terminal-related transcriptional regulator [Streptomyces sp. NPDC058664]|uniref:LuxR C-terminal-related transcriptional regulator n=1 Tax=unclassified Streptomyces TaxID=2593676 RepID=UPI00364B4F35
MSGATHTAAPGPRLYDRTTELAAVARLSAGAGIGTGGVLFVTGDPGEGRTALLARAAHDFPGIAHRVAAPPHRSPWSGVRALCTALAPHPSAGRRALRLARGEDGIAAALDGLTGGRPVLICLDDLHLWDAHSRAALTTAWREHGSRSGGTAWLVSAARHHRLPEVPETETVRLGRLTRAGARALLADVCAVPPPDRVVERLLDEAAGHPGVLVSAARRLASAPVAVPPSWPLVDGAVLAEVYGGLVDSLPADSRRLLAVVALTGRTEAGDPPPAPRPGPRHAHEPLRAAEPQRPPAHEPVRTPGSQPPSLLEPFGAGGPQPPPAHEPVQTDDPQPTPPHEPFRVDESDPFQAYEVSLGAVLATARATRTSVEPLDGLITDGLLRRRGDSLRFDDPFLGRAALAAAPASRGGGHPGTGEAPAPTGTAPGRTVVPADPTLVRGEGHRADRLGPPAAVRALAPVVRGRSQLVRGLAALAGGPVMDAHEALLQAAELLGDRAPAEAADARFLAMEAAWAGGDVSACLAALDLGKAARGTERDFVEGLRAALDVRLDQARSALARVVARDGAEDDPRLLLRAGSAALVIGDTAAASRVHARALARARAEHRTALVPRALEHLAYAELRAGRYSRAARTAHEGLRAAEQTGQRNVAAHQHAVLALVASVAGDGNTVTEHAGRALDTARPHGLVQAATLAEWALARAEFGRGLAAQATARLLPLVRPGPRSGHFALRMLVVPCFVEAAVVSGRRAEARVAADEYAVWAAQGVDGAAPAQLARCRALLARGEEPAYWFGEAVRRHDSCGNDFERARTLLAYGTWLRRRRRPGDARGPLSDALVTFERAAAEGWAEHARSELRATGGASDTVTDPAALGRLTPQQQRIARLVAGGATNREVADRLSLSPRTVDHHLRSVFARLGIRSRVELPAVVGRWDTHPEAHGGEASGVSWPRLSPAPYRARSLGPSPDPC